MLLSIAILLLIISGVCFLLSYRLYMCLEFVQAGFVFVRVRTRTDTFYGWVKKSSINNMDAIDIERYQWFIELISKKTIVVKIEEIELITRVSNPVLLALKVRKRF